MTPRRVAAAMALILTSLILQATLVGPVAAPFSVCLPAVVVGCVALVSGPGTGISLGFATGLLADLGSEHPAGLLAFVWLGVGVCCGLFGQQLRSVRDGALVVGLVGAISSVVAALLLLVLHQQYATLGQTLLRAGPTAVGDVVLALLVLPLVRAMLNTDALRRPPSPSAQVWAGING
jgi:rod shape-determining protein MreD